MPGSLTSRTPADDQARANALLALVTDLARELQPGRPRLALALDSSLERDAGIDSLARIELSMRLERALGHAVPEALALEAETIRDLLRIFDFAPTTAIKAGATITHAPPAPAPSSYAPPHAAHTFMQVLDWHAERQPDRPYLHLYTNGEQPQTLRYGDLARAAERVAAGLREHALEPGQCVALMLPTGLDFFHGFFGILLAGGIPVPIYPPQRIAQLEEHLLRQIGILRNAQARLLITFGQVLSLAPLLKSHLPELRAVVTVEQLAVDTTKPVRVPRATDDLALLQYTSGSTGNPKGVALSHANLLANVRAMGSAARVSSEDVFVSWLPLYHDMGLIGACLGTLYYSFPLILMSPLAFIARPQRWLHAIHRHRGTMSAAPNFAYELCARKITEEDLAGLDLDCWRMAFNGAEPVSADTLEHFCRRLQPYGFRRSAMAPVYGLAECSVGLSFPPPGRGPNIDTIRREAFARRGRAEPAGADEGHAMRVVGCGFPLPGHQIRVVDDDGREVGERVVGRVEFSGPSATRGYYRNEEATRALIHGEWLDSGDYGYLAQGEIFLTGRAKDLIIRAGRNLYPYELEQAVSDVPGIHRGGVAVFAVQDADSASERVVVLAETRERSAEARRALRERITLLAQDLLQTAPDDIVLAPPRTVLRTSSGKIRRAACRDVYLRGRLTRRSPVWMQFAHLVFAGIGPAWTRARRWLFDHLFAAYAWAAFGLAALPAWLLLMTLPRLSWRLSSARFFVRVLGLCTGTRIRIRGLEHLPRDRACVIVSNHMSYLDGIVLIAALPRAFSFVAKRELRENFFVRTLLQAIDTQFVERFAAHRGVQDAAQLSAAVAGGRCLLFFPEGTFTRAPGLLPFRTGAFVVAAQAGVPVVPVTIRGTRSMLRGDLWFPRPGSVSVTVEPPIEPQDSGWDTALALRNAARAEILRHCGEPDLAAEAVAAASEDLPAPD